MAPNSKFKNPVNKIAGNFNWEAKLKNSSKNIEKCRRSSWDWAKSANGDTADFLKLLRVFGHKNHILRDI